MEAPIRFTETEQVDPNTFVVHQIAGEGLGPVATYINTMVITGDEPVIVDTGVALTRPGWMERTFAVVDPQDVRWIFLSHDDVDHTGNLDEALSACPNATLVCNWAMVERHTNCFDFPLHRCRWVMDGESFDVGDRTLFAIRPPVFDSPTTRGLYDPKTQVYWAVDTFATPLPDASMGIADLDQDFWEFGLMLFALGAVSPWITMTDPVKYNRHVDRTQDLDIVTIAACHSPVIEGPYIEKAFARIRQLATLDLPELPGQSILDQIVAATSQAPA
jgi:flavorubredoxin